jgi:hypothetical protein
MQGLWFEALVFTATVAEPSTDRSRSWVVPQ